MPLPFDPPVVLAPMAGITNRAFRSLARESAHAVVGDRGVGMYVSEMVTSRALVERSAESLDLVTFGPDEDPRAVQLYGVDPATVAAAVRMLVDEDRADHIDLNFGCPVPKVTRKGGGSALPWKRDLFRGIVHDAIAAADGRVPVSVKMRKGIDDDHLTYLEAGRAAAEEGVAWVALHGRTAAQMYAGTADWDAIARLKEALAPLGTPVLGQRRHLDGRRRHAHGRADRCRRRRRRPRLPGPAVAVRPAGRGLRRGAGPRGSGAAGGPRTPSAGTPSCSSTTTASSRAAATSASTWPGTSRASACASRSGRRSAP